MFYALVFTALILWILIMAGVAYAIDKPSDDAYRACKEFDRIHTPPKRDPNWKPKEEKEDRV